MKLEKNARNFALVLHPKYVPPHVQMRLVAESSAVGDYDDSLSHPGSSYLWIGEHHHLDRDEVAQLVTYLKTWLKTKRLQ